MEVLRGGLPNHMTQDKWLAERLAYLRGLKAPSDQQRLLLMLADKPDRTADAVRIINAEKAAERKARPTICRPASPCSSKAVAASRCLRQP